MAKYSALILFLGFVFFVNAQDSLCVFKTNGVVFKTNNNKIVPIKKGDYLINKDVFLLNENTDILAIDKSGNTYFLNKKGDYNFKNLINHKYEKTNSGLTNKYFKLIWKELINSEKQTTLIGGVFRGEQLMVFPGDGYKIASSKIKFNWNESDNNSKYFLFVRNIEKNHMTKIQINTTEITLYKNNLTFKEANNFEWFVSTDEFPNIDNKVFFAFTLIKNSEYDSLLKDFKSLQQSLQNLGLSREEITLSFCELYGICK